MMNNEDSQQNNLFDDSTANDNGSTTNNIAANLVDAEITEEIKDSFIKYSMSVIASRALPDVRDGLKPVQRRILFALHDLKISPGSRYKKSSRVVGEVVGKYHPHGDSSIYGAIVLMAQPFTFMYPLIDGQGNFGSIDKDAPAAMRYTEVRMSPTSAYILENIDKNTVDFIDNYDGAEREPKVLPGRLPNLLMNGSSGIAVGIATNIPPHNLKELITGISALIKNPTLSISDLIKYIPGPDFPTVGKIINQQDILNIYETGRGSVIMEGEYHIEKEQRHERIVLTEFPFKVNKAELIKKIVDLINTKKINGISDIKDESNRKGIRVVITIKTRMNSLTVMSQIIKHTRFRTSFPVNLMGLIKQKPQLFNLKSLLTAYIDHQNEVIKRALQFDLAAAEKKSHILKGFVIVLDDIDTLINLIKTSADRAEASKKIIAHFAISKVQSEAILSLTLSRLTNLERQKIINELLAISELIKKIQSILSEQSEIDKIIINNLKSVNKKLLKPRLTRFEYKTLSFNEMDLIPNQQYLVSITKNNYIKRVLYENFRTQRRGGVGSRSLKLYKDDDILKIIIANSHDVIYFVTDKGRFFCSRVFDIPEQTKSTKGLPIVNLIEKILDTGEKVVTAFTAPKELDLNDLFLCLVTRNCRIKKTPAFKLLRPDLRASRNFIGKKCMKTINDDPIVCAFFASNQDLIAMGSHLGKAVVTDFSKIRPQLGNATRGVRGVKLAQGDYIVSACAVHESELLLSVYAKGYGKLVNANRYRITSRIAKGVKTLGKIKVTGSLIALLKINENDDLFIINSSGIAIIINASTIRKMLSRVGKGVKIIKLKEETKEVVKSLAIIKK